MDWLAFLRRRLTGDYQVDEFGFDPELTDRVLLAPLRPLYENWFRIEVARRWRTSPTTGGAWWSPTTPAPSPLDCADDPARGARPPPGRP